ncbi:MAG: hypothetical protein A2289_23280 [Deltaproteobacteria bacterium RIFOXYA12_FULL_58_15]|nr:MAG: hypothetical protein A2289_23280 [Deltaproteobacteria bacterium RIFOXYA12_FULL_58_15]
MKRVWVGLAVGLLTACTAPIWRAVDQGDLAQVERLLSAGGDPNYSPAASGGSTLLMLAAERGRADIARLLIDRGAVVDARREGNKNTALHHAVGAGHLTVIKVLLEHGADPFKVGVDNRTARMYAQDAGFREATLLLAQAEAVLQEGAPPLASASLPVAREKLPPLRGSALVMEIKTVGSVSAQLASVATKILLARLDEVEGFSTVTPEDLQLMLSVEKQKDALGCNDVKCMAEVGGALGADFVVYGQIAVVGSQYNLSLTAIDSKRSLAVGRVSVLVAANEDALAASVPNAVASLIAKVARSQVDAGGP